MPKFAFPSASSRHVEIRGRKRGGAKKAKNYAEADALRKEALEAGIILEDSPQGTARRRT